MFSQNSVNRLSTVPDETSSCLHNLFHLILSTHVDLTPNGWDITRERGEGGGGREGEVFNWL
jgi:hypothetical protein